MMEFVTWDDDIPKMMGKIKFHGSKPPTSNAKKTGPSGRVQRSQKWKAGRTRARERCDTSSDAVAGTHKTHEAPRVQSRESSTTRQTPRGFLQFAAGSAIKCLKRREVMGIL